MNFERVAVSAAKVRPQLNALRSEQWASGPDEIIIGKDVLELLSTSMYIDPLTIYREYIQNAADSIDDARREGVLADRDPGMVDIHVEPASREIRIRDNGTGIHWRTFARQLTSLGASSKRGTPARGFRGVGRLAGLGYCQELVFRSRVDGETLISELRWDCRRLQTALRAAEFTGGLTDVIRDIVSVRRIPGDEYPPRFFEVQLSGVIRHRNDRLLSPPVVGEYLAQVAPLPFSPDFRFGAEIRAALDPHVALGELQLRVTGIDGPIYRPHRNTFEIGENVFDSFSDLELIQLPGVDGGIAAVAWVLHHGYTGAIPPKAAIKGLRLRAGNVQVGDNVLLEELFPEQRFNAWSVGEVHVIDRRIVPNGRRDHFQPNVHFNNILNHLSPTARDIARRCRTSSVRRRWLREFDLQQTSVQEKIDIISQGSVSTKDRAKIASTARRGLETMAKIARMDDLGPTEGVAPWQEIVTTQTAKLEQALGAKVSASPLAKLPPGKRRMYEHLFSLIYECAANQSAAKSLIDRIIAKLD